MFLTKGEAICLVLKYSEGSISSKIKLNKLLARLNLLLVPVNLKFYLNKWGSQALEIDNLKSNDYFNVLGYRYMNKDCNKYKITDMGENLVKSVEEKISFELNGDFLHEIKHEIENLSIESAEDVSANEHEKLLIDQEDRIQLKQRASEVHISFLDLNDEIKDIPDNNIADIKFKGLIELCFYLTKYINNKFEEMSDEYDYEGDMCNYYFIKVLDEQLDKFKEEMKKENKDSEWINRLFNYLDEMLKINNHPLSFENPELIKYVK